MIICSAWGDSRGDEEDAVGLRGEGVRVEGPDDHAQARARRKRQESSGWLHIFLQLCCFLIGKQNNMVEG